MLQGGESGSAIELGNPEKSLLIQRIRHADRKMRMPPKKPLTDDEIKDFVKWIKFGATWSDSVGLDDNASSITDADRKFWSFQPVKKPDVPKHDRAKIDNPIDAFLL